eukprot:TRINITY_DN11585_c0_g1_i1.p1 TRINITY_DN11585_c0_g1~~TRINITY_DN11585_c0_g1_i1.p1  ORF type:complete len:993 (-),score=179.05 TRINITY_DN11585_c0_g1_i1:429-3407(-)
MLVRRCKALLGSGRADEAMRDAERAVSLAPSWVETHMVLGEVHTVLLHYEDAVKAFEKGLLMDPLHASLRSTYSHAKELQQNVSSAMKLSRTGSQQSSDWWYCGAFRLHGWRNDSRPQCLMLVSLTDAGSVLAQRILYDQSWSNPPPELYSEFLSVSIGQTLSMRPAHLVVSDPYLARTLSNIFAQIGVSVRPVSAVPAARRSRVAGILLRCTQEISTRSRAVGLIQATPLALAPSLGATIAMPIVREFFGAAAEFLRARPWLWLSDLQPVQLSLPALFGQVPRVLVSVLGQRRGSRIGVRIMTEELDFRAHMLDDPTDERPTQKARKGSQRQPELLLNGEVYGAVFVNEQFIPLADVDFSALHKFEIAHDLSLDHWPLAFADEWTPDVTQNWQPSRPSAQQLIWCAAAMRALAWLPTSRLLAMQKDGSDYHTLDASYKISCHTGATTVSVLYPTQVVPTESLALLPSTWLLQPELTARMTEARVRLKNAPRTAQEHCYRAFITTASAERTVLAEHALALDPNCSDAYLLLAENTTVAGEALQLVFKALTLARANLQHFSTDQQIQQQRPPSIPWRSTMSISATPSAANASQSAVSFSASAAAAASTPRTPKQHSSRLTTSLIRASPSQSWSGATPSRTPHTPQPSPPRFQLHWTPQTPQRPATATPQRSTARRRLAQSLDADWSPQASGAREFVESLRSPVRSSSKKLSPNRARASPQHVQDSASKARNVAQARLAAQSVHSTHPVQLAFTRAATAACRVLLACRRYGDAADVVLEMIDMQMREAATLLCELAYSLLAADRLQDLLAAHSRVQCHASYWLYAIALATFRLSGDSVSAREALVIAALSNQSVVAQLLPDRRLQERCVAENVAGWYGFTLAPAVRNEREAKEYCDQFLWLWARSPGAVEWVSAWVRSRGAAFQLPDEIAAFLQKSTAAHRSSTVCVRAGCGRSGDSVECPHCHRLLYCSGACQKQDAQGHIRVCGSGMRSVSD